MEGVAGFSNSTVSTNSFFAIRIDSTTTPEPNDVLLTLLGTGVGGMSAGASARSIKTGLLTRVVSERIGAICSKSPEPTRLPAG
ncbi:hypothetical protein DAA51_24755 [Bradyrhizobium sp. WBAH10]|nr:hypothetical protein [Bradyrhizobium sp. WBAH30]MDD1547194.1 hypothetical protein [Bradyrhizobium sp. WBAH41]MDD1560765.1 hypothetical protein [Bradyrhizobium sp. WBAH23]NRB91786.1 hypothetical protein [Bradyrhizobium sp. WBAH10]QCJ76642.1 hypothetical protein DAA51_24755 [Bradyrhizobium sp. WBAH10]